MKQIGEMIQEYKGSTVERKQELDFVVLCEVRDLLQQLLAEFREARRTAGLEG